MTRPVAVLSRAAVALMLAATVARAERQEAPAPVVSETVAAQVLLDRAGFSPGEIDGRRGRNLQRAISAFQQSNGMSVSGQLDEATWQLLSERAGSDAPLTTYEITEADLAGPFTERIPSDLMQQATLPALNFTSPLEALGERFHASPQLLKSLNPDATFSQAGERILVPNVAQPAPATADDPDVTIYVTKATSSLTVEDSSGRILFHAPVTTGSEHDPLPIGEWKIKGVERMPAFHYNPKLFWDAEPSHSKARIAPGPNNPVGVAWIDLSKEHYGIHGTPEPSRIGHVESHGCVRLTNWDVERLSGFVRPGSEVVFR